MQKLMTGTVICPGSHRTALRRTTTTTSGPASGTEICTKHPGITVPVPSTSAIMRHERQPLRPHPWGPSPGPEQPIQQLRGLRQACGLPPLAAGRGVVHFSPLRGLFMSSASWRQAAKDYLARLPGWEGPTRPSLMLSGSVPRLSAV